MDYFAPVARRTRAQEAQYYRAVYEELQKKKKKGKGKVGSDESSGKKCVGDDNVDKSRVRVSRKDDLECCDFVTIDDDFEEDLVEVGHRKDVSKKNVAKKGKDVYESCDSIPVDSLEESSTSSSGSDGDSDSTYDSKKQSSDEDEDVDGEEDVEEDEDDDDEEEEERCAKKKRPYWANVSTPAQTLTHFDVGSSPWKKRKVKGEGTATRPISFDVDSSFESSTDDDDIDDIDVEIGGGEHVDKREVKNSCYGPPDDKEEQKEDEERSEMMMSLKRKRSSEVSACGHAKRNKPSPEKHVDYVAVPKRTPEKPVDNVALPERVKSCSVPESSINEKRNKDLPTAADPVILDAEEIALSGSSTDDDHHHEVGGNGEDKANDVVHADDEAKRKVSGKEEGEFGKSMKIKNIRGLKGNQVFQLLINSIWEKGDVLQQDVHNSEDETAEPESAPPDDEPLPLKFYFGIKKAEPVEKSDYEKEMEFLFDEMNFALRSDEIGSLAPPVEDADEQEAETDSSTFCPSGKHHYIIDEEIGIKCIFCSHVKLEIKYVMPSMVTSNWERSNNKTSASGDKNFSTWDGVQFPGTCNGSDGYVHTTGTVWDKCPEIRSKMFPHQREGFEFIWKNIAGGIELDAIKSKRSDGIGGCVISHAPGTGKTFLTIAFLHTYIQVFKESRPLIMAPSSMLLTWEEEFKKWNFDIPFHNLNSALSGKEHPIASTLTSRSRTDNIRLLKLYSWSRGKSILGISYHMFEMLAGERSGEVGREQKRKTRGSGEVGCEQMKRTRGRFGEVGSEQIRKILLEMPTLLVLDEGHTPRNERSLIWKVLKNIKTERRIILSGTPFQNNFEELRNTLQLVRPKFLDKISCETQSLYGRGSKSQEDETRGKWASLTNSISKHADNGLLDKLRTMIAPFVHVHKGSILQKNLPGLRDCVVYLNPTPLQKQILEVVQQIPASFELEHAMAVVAIHPSLWVKNKWFDKEKDLSEKIKSKMFRLNPNEGVKTRFLMEIIRLSEAMNEKVLVFSQFTDPFKLIKKQLYSIFKWTNDNEVVQMDGTLDMKVRQSLINRFNDPNSSVRVLLASTKACGEGISLVGASRVVLLDVVWNPSVERQAISRAYRLGQKKVVHTYHLIASGTLEEDKYCKQVQKDLISKLVFSTKHEDCEKQNISSTLSDDRILDEMVGHQRLKDMFDKITYQSKEQNFIKTFVSETTKESGNGNFDD